MDYKSYKHARRPDGKFQEIRQDRKRDRWTIWAHNSGLHTNRKKREKK